jgi:hypothetical protein
MEYMKKYTFPVAFFCALFQIIAIQPSWVSAKNRAEIGDVEVMRNQGNLEVSFRILNCFTPKMEEAIQSGVQATFRIRIVLEEPGFPLFKSQLLNLTFDHSIKYDRLKNAFYVTIPELPEREHIAEDFTEAKQLMSTVRSLPVLPAWRLEDDEEYRLRIKAELSKVRLPLFFRYIFFFVSLWDFETDWHQVILQAAE